jgi:signal transduction histidine kinase
VSSDEVKASGEMLEEMNRLWTIAKAFSTTAHDVNNALQVISGSAELLATRTDLDPVVQRRVEAVRVQAEKAAATIDRLLTYTRAVPGSLQRLDLAAMVETAVAMRACSLGRARVGVAVARSDDQPYWVAADSPKLLQLLLDLLLSFETLLTGRPEASIGFQFDRKPGVVRVTVKGTAVARAEEPSFSARLAVEHAVGGALWAAARLAAGQSWAYALEEHEGSAVSTLAIRGA